MMNLLEKPEFDFWWKQFMVRFYLSFDRILDVLKKTYLHYQHWHKL